jgi:hypothetical protein
MDATDRLMGSTKNAARLREAIATPDSEHRVFESVEDLKDARGMQAAGLRGSAIPGANQPENGEVIAASDRGNRA